VPDAAAGKPLKIAVSAGEKAYAAGH
jgi:hypothetical protein